MGAATPDDRRVARGRRPFVMPSSQTGWIGNGFMPLDETVMVPEGATDGQDPDGEDDPPEDDEETDGKKPKKRGDKEEPEDDED